MTESLHIIVQGRVHGVAFRVNTQKKATALNIRGWVSNLANGDVEIIAVGDKQSISELVSWCHKGPMLAKVEQVIAQPHYPTDLPENFQIR